MTALWHRLIVLVVASFLTAGPAAAYRFGTDESVNKIQDVTLKGPKDETLFLGYLTRIRWFLGGIYVEDAGYVLGVNGDSKRFYRMPEGEELKGFQRNGFLPDPLPRYALSAWDYVFGYSLWWGLAIGGLAMWWGERRRKAAGSEPAQGAPAPPSGPTSPQA